MNASKNTIKALIWDMGGVLLRTEDDVPRKRLADRLGTTRRSLEELVFASRSAQQAMRGLMPIEEHWLEVGKVFHLNDQELLDFQNEFWAGDRLDEELVDTIRALRSRYSTGLLSNAWSDIREVAGKRFRFLDAFDVIVFPQKSKWLNPMHLFIHIS